MLESDLFICGREMRTGRERSSFARRRALLCGAIAGALLVVAPAAVGHVERASYWPDPAPDNAGGVPTGGAVPEVRSLFSALDGAERGDTRVVCEGGEAIPYQPAGAIVQSRQDVEISRAKVNRLEKKQKRLRAKGFKRKAAKVKKKLTKAKRAYRAALAAEQAERKKAGDAYQQQLNQELAEQAAYKQDLLEEPSMERLDASLADAVANGYVVRPSEGSEPFSQAEADQLWDFNARLLAACEYNEIQPAVMDSGNNDRVVVMPGLYTEPTARSQRTNDPSCDKYEEVNDRPDGMGGLRTGANTYTYVFHCPNDQNLIAVLGRLPNHDAIPIPPLEDRHGIPDNGACIRCNLQLEGSGVSADDVVVEAGDPARGDGQDPDPENDNKDVGIRIDRADGSVVRKLTVRHVREHGIYHHEVDGYVAEHFKVHYAHEYGTLEFTSDHGLIQDCDTDGAGDAGIYPGSAPDTGEQGVSEGHITEERLNTEITRCDMHHNAAGYSGTAANAVWLHHNDFYDNALGFTTDVFTAAGHPGFPQDSDLIENNEFYDNNFNPYLEACAGPSPTENYDPENPTCSDIDPTIPVPVGTGAWVAGGNNNEFVNNHFFDNWRRGLMIFSVPDAFVCGDSPTAGGNQQHGCDPAEVNTSHRNEVHGNVMGQTPSGEEDPNGVDFWWDQFPGNQNNCWFANVGPDGTRDSLEAEPPLPPAETGPSIPQTLPHDCATSVGTSSPPSESELLGCLAHFEGQDEVPCTWFTTPPEP